MEPKPGGGVMMPVAGPRILATFKSMVLELESPQIISRTIAISPAR
jgi:hypothetical protein